MSHTDGTDAFDRLRAADPAPDTEPNLAALRSKVDAAAGAAPDELALRRRPQRVLQVAAASVAVLAVGAGGFALGAQGGASPSSFSARDTAVSEASEPGAPFDSDGAAPPITLGGPGAAGGRGSGSAGEEAATDGAFNFSSAPMGGASDMAGSMIWPGWGWRSVFTASGLSSSGGSAAAYGFDPAAVLTDETFQSLADAFGVEGTVRTEDGHWSIDSSDGTSPSLYLSPDGAASFWYYDPTKDTWFCAPQTLESRDDDGGGSSASVDPCSERDLGDAPQGDEAVAAAQDVIVSLGLDPADFEFEASTTRDLGTASYSYVQIHPVIDGQRSENAWSVSFTGGGLQSASGYLAPLVDLGEYQVISPREAVDRLNDPRFGASNTFYPANYRFAEEGAVQRPSVPPSVTPGSDISWPVQQVAITDSRLGTAQHYLDNGSVILVPTYQLSAADGRSWSVIAVADSHLDFAATR